MSNWWPIACQMRPEMTFEKPTYIHLKLKVLSLTHFEFNFEVLFFNLNKYLIVSCINIAWRFCRHVEDLAVLTPDTNYFMVTVSKS
jgi:hypothetical protein